MNTFPFYPNTFSFLALPSVNLRMSYHLEHEEHKLTVSSAVASLVPDLVFVSTEGEQVEASSFLLSLHSPLLQALLADHRDKRDEVTALSMPLSASGLHTLVALLSSGRALGTSEQGLREVVEQAATVLGVPLDNLQLGRRGAAKTQQRPQQLPEQLAPQIQLVGDSKEALADPDEPVACDACSKVFSAQSYLDKHTKAKHGEQNLVIKREVDVRPFSCDLCKREFKQASHLKVHVTKVHQPKVEKVEEDVLAAESANAGQGSADDSSEKIHVEEAPSGMIEPEVVSSKNMETAGTIESVEPECNLCGQTPGGETALIEHKQAVHMKTSEDGETFECEFCGFKTQKINFINTHIKFMHRSG